MPLIFTKSHFQKAQRLRRILTTIALLSWTTATIFLALPFLPHLLYRLSPSTPTRLATTLAATTKDSTTPSALPTKPLPPLDSSLPKENGLIIDKIGVKGAIHEGADFEQQLRLGIWREPKFGTPDSNLPTVLASHRWGYLAWTNAFRRLNSFYALPDLKVGDQVQVIWNQRKYTYEITKEDTGTTISSFDFDLILYTCQLWDSPVRVFKYARRLP